MNKGRAESSMSEAAHKPESVLRVSSGAQQTVWKTGYGEGRWNKTEGNNLIRTERRKWKK